MSVDRDGALALRGQRVSARTGGQELEPRVLRAVTPDDVAILADARGVELRILIGDLDALSSAQLACGGCGGSFTLLHPAGELGLRCAECTRRWAAVQTKPRELCEDCGFEGAYYSPAAKAFRCASCHAQHGTNSGLFAEARVREALVRAEPECKGKDLHDELHHWKKMRGKWICRGCQVKSYDKPDTY